MDQICKDIMSHFPIEGKWLGSSSYGRGHINETFVISYRLQDGLCRRYILQKINRSIFQNVEGLMNNIVNVTDFLRRKIESRGGDPMRETLYVIRTNQGAHYYEDENQSAWRLYPFIEGTVALQKIDKPEDFYEVGVSFGNFQNLLSDYPAHTLVETIPHFHDTPKRYQDFLQILAKDKMRRAKAISEEVAFVKLRAGEMGTLTELLGSGELPLRVTHNDTKLNNILFDEKTKKGLCVIDLDTVMPGLSHFDFGDSIRFGASSSSEDERDLSKVHVRLDLYEIFTKGYLEAAGNALTHKEIKYLPWGAKLITLECGMRFLTDYLAGDIYFRIHYPDHNLVRARNQFALVADMERKWDAMNQVFATEPSNQAENN